MSDEPPPAPEFSVIVVSYNTRDMTLACLASVYAQTTGAFEVVVVDNASIDGSAEAIAAQFPQARLIAESVNHGFAAAHHVAVPQCRAPWLVLLNPDTEVLDGALDKLMAFRRRRPEAGIWGGRTVFADGRLNPASCWRRQTPWSLFCRAAGLAVIFPRSEFFNSETYGGWPRDSVREVDIVTGCLFLISRESWDRLGGFDPVFVMYGEEADLCLRARRIGLRPAITPEATIVHHGGASETVRADKLVRLLRAKAELVKRHFAPGTRALGLMLLAAWPASRLLALSVLARVPGTARFRDAAAPWRTVWRRRGEWRHGF
ncbi:glycosyltransferase family 2 protein [Roseovarius sp. D22-M7]|uniref:glycosyltransferase family 2 protein n=1 Tax=Roseovarius sp. D22-M7 TaxID=3127116 RepID=UPI00300F8A9C